MVCVDDFYVMCNGDEGEVCCGATTSGQRCETRAKAIQRWNRRIADDWRKIHADHQAVHSDPATAGPVQMRTFVGIEQCNKHQLWAMMWELYVLASSGVNQFALAGNVAMNEHGMQVLHKFWDLVTIPATSPTPVAGGGEECAGKVGLEIAYEISNATTSRSYTFGMVADAGRMGYLRGLAARDAAAGEVERLTHERDEAIAEANRRDAKWMDGIRVACSAPIQFNVNPSDAQTLTLDKFIRGLTNQVDKLTREKAEYLEAHRKYMGGPEAVEVEKLRGDCETVRKAIRAVWDSAATHNDVPKGVYYVSADAMLKLNDAARNLWPETTT